MNMAGTARHQRGWLETTRPDWSAVPCHDMPLTTAFAMSPKVLVKNHKTCKQQYGHGNEPMLFLGMKIQGLGCHSPRNFSGVPGLGQPRITLIPMGDWCGSGIRN